MFDQEYRQYTKHEQQFCPTGASNRLVSYGAGRTKHRYPGISFDEKKAQEHKNNKRNQHLVVG